MVQRVVAVTHRNPDPVDMCPGLGADTLQRQPNFLISDQGSFFSDWSLGLLGPVFLARANSPPGLAWDFMWP